MRNILITTALPYANGEIHLGHLVEYLQADFWSRFQKMRGHNCYYICADDTHGTPIMVESRKQNITPEELIQKAWHSHTQDFKDFQIEFSHYSSTNSPENKALCEEFYKHIKNKNYITVKNIDQLFCEHDKMFLPDRFVKGSCPNCGAKDQYGDSCDICGATYSPADFKDPYCSICKTKPVIRASEHVLFKLNEFKDYLFSWLPEHLSKETANKMKEWFNEPLRDWDISRDEPYFGFKIPGYDSKYFYVWVDAPMGYISSFAQFAKTQGLDWKNFWNSSQNEIYHFIGKDIVYFHALFWPALLKAAEYNSPKQIFVHGHLTVNGEKMSKSKGTKINARHYLNHLDPSFLRYYYATKMNSAVDDLDLNLEDFVHRTNSELVGKITNLASRSAQLLQKKLDGKIGVMDAEGKALLEKVQKQSTVIADHFENRDFAKALNEIKALTDEANKYFDEQSPWKIIAENPEKAKSVLSSALNIFRVISIYLKPILPYYTQKAEKLFKEAPYIWNDAQKSLENHELSPFEPLIVRIEAKSLAAILEEAKT